jgi:hypothetical protein
LYAAVEGVPVLPFRDASGKMATYLRPLGGGAVRVAETWFFLTQSASYDAVVLWRAELGVPRQIGSYNRPLHHYGYEGPRLVRRATTGELGLLVAGPPDLGERSGSYYVLPVDMETGELREAIVLDRRDLVDAIQAQGGLPRCAAGQDGWLLDTPLEVPPNIEVTNAQAFLDTIELRVRLDPKAACVDALSARSGPVLARDPRGAKPGGRPLIAPPGRKGKPKGPTVPMAVTEKQNGRRWGLVCEVTGPKTARGGR